MMEKPKYIRGDVLLKEYSRKVGGTKEVDISEFYGILTLLEEELILNLADKIKEERKNDVVKRFGNWNR